MDTLRPSGPLRGARLPTAGRNTQDWGTLGVPTGPAKLLHVVHTPGATLRHAFYLPGARVARHVHPHAEFVYGVGGPCLETSDAAPGSKRRLTYHPVGYAHSLDYHGPTHVLAIELVAGHERLPDTTVALPATFYAVVWEMMSRVVRQAQAEEIDSAIGELVDRTRAAASASRPPWLGEVLNTLHDEWRTPPSAAALATRFGLSPAYLCRAFKRAMSVTLQQYGLLLRIDRARGLLWGTSLPIPQVAAETGFADQSHLTRTLGAVSNSTPLRLRWSAPCEEPVDAPLAL